MKKSAIASVLLLSSLLAAQMSLTAAAEDTGDTLLISPNPNGTESAAASFDIEAALQSTYEQTAGMYAYDGIASQLYSIRVLLGDGVNFNLEDLPDRQQACVMVVRMRGEEEAALAAYQAGEITCPFTDVTDEWVKPYLAWLYEKKITLGVGDGKFGNATCSAQEYVTFMLRALGYTVTWDMADNTDILYADVLDYARDLHLWDGRLACEPAFSRGVMSAVTYQTLAADVKGTDDRLLSVLTQAGAIDAQAAQPILDLYDEVDAAAALELSAIPVLDGVMKLTAELAQNDVQITKTVGAPDGDTEDTAFNGMVFAVGMDYSDGKQELAMQGDFAVQSAGITMTIPMGMWLHDGAMYTEIFGLKQKLDVVNTEEFDSVAGILNGNLSSFAEDSAYQYYTITDVYVETLEDETVLISYDVTDFMWPQIVAEMNIENFTSESSLSVLFGMEKHLDANGVLLDVATCMYAVIEETDAAGVYYSTERLNETIISYTGWGEDVSLTFPDFTQFTSVSADA